MGRSSQRKQEQDRVKDLKFVRTLSKPRVESGPDLDVIRAKVVEGLDGSAIRDLASWPCPLRTRDDGRITLAMARHAYATYPVPYHLERIWLAEEPLPDAESLRRKAWFLTVAQGRSLHKEHTSGFLTKKETHRFLVPPVRLTFREALWYAVGRSFTDDHGTCLRIARSKVARDNVTPFWKDAARFFCQAGIPLHEINDLVDYLAMRHAESQAFTLKGRTLPSLRAAMTEWHKDLARRAKVAGGNWAGYDIEGHVHIEEGEKPGQNVTWTIVQILTGDDLAEEGSRQHHCVASYKSSCMSGNCSIWSLRREARKGVERVLTMEMRKNREIVQIRGFANRLATQDEMRLVRKWAAENGVSVRQG